MISVHSERDDTNENEYENEYIFKLMEREALNASF